MVLLDSPGGGREADHLPGKSPWQVTFLCRAPHGEARPGFEPEKKASQIHAITKVRRIDLKDPREWESPLKGDPFISPSITRIRAVLCYSPQAEG